MTRQEALKLINQVGEDFGWQMGKVGANYENGYMKAIRDCKAVFQKDDHIVEANKMIVSADKKQMIEDCIKHRCENFTDCEECDYFDSKDRMLDDYYCSIRDKDGNVPYYQEWDMESALGVDHIVEANKMIVTNADRIRSMTDEELATFLNETYNFCPNCGADMRKKEEPISYNSEEVFKDLLKNPMDSMLSNKYTVLRSLERLQIKLTHEVQKISKHLFGLINEEGKTILITFSRTWGTCVTTSYNIYVEEEFECVSHFDVIIYHDEKRMCLYTDYENSVKYEGLVKQVTEKYYVNEVVE